MIAVRAIDDHWHDDRNWWEDQPIRRDYFRVVLADESLRNVFLDLHDHNWYVDRTYPIL